MICAGIDVSKDKHDCFILSSEGEVLADVFTISNNAEGFDALEQTIVTTFWASCSTNATKCIGEPLSAIQSYLC